MKRINLILFSILFLLLANMFLVSGFQGTSDSYTSDNRPDSFSEDDASSTSFTQRLIGGIQAVGEYITDTFTGRFGILTAGQNLVINITSHEDNDIVIRGNDVVSGEDDKGYVPNSFNLTAKVFDSSSNNGFQGANCFFYDGGSFFGNSTTDSSGDCTMNFTQTSLGVGVRNFSVNYSITTTDSISIKKDTVNISINRYITGLTLGNKRTSGCFSGSTCYHHGDNATLGINISKINESATFQYDPQNISANATNAAETVYPNGDFYYPGSITRTAVGEFNTSIEVNASFGGDIRWDALVSDNNFTDFLSTAVHSDIELCQADWGAFSDWSACSSGTQTKTRTDSTGCTDVETQSCGVLPPPSCFPAGTKILMADGTYKNIEDVKIGDEIESYDLASNEKVSAKVLELESPLREGFYSINNKVNVTNEHPFYVLRKNGEFAWAAVIEQAAKEDIGSNELAGLEIYGLEIGDKFFTSNGEWESVESIEYYPGEVQTYNLKTIDNYHVFFANDFLVHNKGECVPGAWSDWSDWSECIDDQETRTRSNGCNTETEFRPCDCIPLIACDDDWSQCIPSQQLTIHDIEQPVFENLILGEESIFKIEKITERNFVNLELQESLITGSVVQTTIENVIENIRYYFNLLIGNSITGRAVITSSCEARGDLGNTQCHPSRENRYQECVTRGINNVRWKNVRCDRGLVCGGEGECVLPSTCILTSASWSTSNAIEGEQVTLIVNGDGCEGQEIIFEILEDDLFIDDPVSQNPSTSIIERGQASTDWIAEYQDNLGDSEYFFIATLIEDSSMSIKSGIMIVQKLFIPPTCGDGILETGEECDDGISNGQPGKCNLDCTGITPSVCGNGIIEEGEVCDSNDKACSALGYSGTHNCLNDCTNFGLCITEESCGDGIVNGNEFCDDGNIINNDGCPNNCQPEVIEEPVESICGNSILEGNETCDDSNVIDGDGCSSLCEIESVCGNGILEGIELCDDSNVIDGDGCSSFCEIEGDTGFNESQGLGEGQVLLGLSETIEVTINKGDLLSITYEEKRESLVLITIIRIVTSTSVEEEEVHGINVDSIDNTRITITISSDSITKDIFLGDTETFDFSGTDDIGDNGDTGEETTDEIITGGIDSVGGEIIGSGESPEFSPPDSNESTSDKIPEISKERVTCWFLEIDLQCSSLSLDSTKTCKEHSYDYYDSRQECEDASKTSEIISNFLDLENSNRVLIVLGGLVGVVILLKIIKSLSRRKKPSKRKSRVIKLFIFGGILLLVFSFLTFSESPDINTSLTGSVVNEKNINLVFIPLAVGDIQGTQTKLCRDLNKCETDESWIEIQECIISEGENYIRFTPTNRNLLIANNTRIDFEGDIKQNPGDLIKVDWFLNNEFQKGDSLFEELISEFSRVFSVDSSVRAELSINSQTQIEVWEIKVNPDAVEDCEESWSCDYTECDGFFKNRIDETCLDNNACGTNLFFPPAQVSCDCIPEYQCEEWAECSIDYDLNSILKGEPTLNKLQTRTCHEVKGCINEKQVITQEQECSLGISINVRTVEWCFEDYVELTEVESGNLVSRIKSVTINNILSLDIGFITTEFEGICGYCFDGIKNFDEIGVDCGGFSCPTCRLLGPDNFFDYMLYLKVGLWTLLSLLVISLMYNNKKNVLDKLIFFKNWKVKKPKRLKLYIGERKVYRVHRPRIKIPKIKIPGLDVRISIGRKSRARKPVYVPKERVIKRALGIKPKVLTEFMDMKREEHKKEISKSKESISNEDFEALKFGIARLRELEIELNYLDTKAFPAEATSIRSKLKDVSKILIIERELESLKNKIQGKSRKRERKVIKHKTRVIKKRIKKKQILRSEFSSLRKQLKEWKAKGYSDAAKLERKLDELEEKKK